MWYYKLSKTIKNVSRITIYLIISYIQKNSETTYKKYSTTSQKNEIEENKYYFKKNLTICDECDISTRLKCVCLILIQDFNFKLFFKNLKAIKRLRIIDINFFGHLGLNVLINIGFFDILNKEERVLLKKESMKNYLQLKKTLSNKEIVILGNNKNFTKSMKISNNRPLFICNDSVKEVKNINSELTVLSFGDPMFHFSPHKTAIDYLKIVKDNKNYIDFIIVPINTLPILKQLDMNTKIIGVTSSNRGKNFITIGELDIVTKKTHNILTQYMLPIAMSISKSIFLGAVSTSKTNNDKLWQYDEKLVKKNEKSFAFGYSFFKDRNFKNYYKQHFKFLNRIIKENENIKLL
tara:strand:+ start:3990 stop:5039 length:1050 start_codon:yes stop_codon:yes gene_type:complete